MVSVPTRQGYRFTSIVELCFFDLIAVPTLSRAVNLRRSSYGSSRAISMSASLTIRVVSGVTAAMRR